MTATIPDVDITTLIDFEQLEKDVLDIPCEVLDPEIHADEFVSATMLWRSHCTDVALCDDCHKGSIEEVIAATGWNFLCFYCMATIVLSSATHHPLGPIK